ncbi:hypothetical protein DY000_02030535 [Brassica cretica]|uniref:Uncharacterized protein n=1 Tax=Brassica cretica TaxID=69181 RepID=A0ABQ7DSC3_BRACR|nr:hypothetical protein DY000_02030535 [Brassica cretica]
MERKRREIVSVESNSMDVAPYEHMPSTKFQSSSVDRPYQSENQKHGGERSGKRLASAIVTPVRQLASMEYNVTVRSNLNRSLTFSPQGSAIMIENGQIIGALNDLVEPFDGAMMECDDHADDLLGQDLMDLEAMGQSSGVAESSRAKGSDKDTKRAKSGSKGSAPLGIQMKKIEFLRRGSPRLRSTKARDERPRSNRYGGSRFGARPYGRYGKEEVTWREKAKEKVSMGSGSMAVVPVEHNLSHKPLLITEEKTFRAGIHRSRGEQDDKGQLRWREKRREIVSVESSSMDVAPYEHMPSTKFQSSSVDRPYQSENQKHGGEQSGKRLVSAIVTPVRQLASMEDNVTVQSNLNRSLTFSPQGSAIMTENDQ